MTFDKAAALLAATTLMLLGVKIIHNPKLHSRFIYQREFDLTGFNVPFGIALIIGSVFIFWTGVIKPKKVNFICPKCEELFRWTESLGDKCPKCGTDLEDLEGFYEGHPELRYRKKAK